MLDDDDGGGEGVEIFGDVGAKECGELLDAGGREGGDCRWAAGFGVFVEDDGGEHPEDGRSGHPI